MTDNKEKGSIDIATLVIVMVPMTLFLLIGGQRLSKTAIQTDLGAELDFNKKSYEGEVIAYQVLNYRGQVGDETIRDKIRRLPYSDNPQDLNDTIKNTAQNILQKYNSNAYYRNEFQLVIDYPDNGRIIASSTGNTYDLNQDLAELHVASAENRPVEVRVETPR